MCNVPAQLCHLSVVGLKVVLPAHPDPIIGHNYTDRGNSQIQGKRERSLCENETEACECGITLEYCGNMFVQMCVCLYGVSPSTLRLADDVTEPRSLAATQV
jgi:hypothetical protein